MESLTKNWVKLVHENEEKEYDDTIFAQVIEVIDYGDGNKKVKNCRYRLKITDGVNFLDTMVLHKIANRMNKDIKKYDIIKISKLTLRDAGKSKKKVCMILKAPVVMHSGLVKAIGDEKQILKNKVLKDAEDVDLKIRPELFEERKILQESDTNVNFFTNKISELKNYSTHKKMDTTEDGDGDGEFTAVKVLSNISKNWTIKVRLTKKGNIRRYTNSNGEGCLMNIELMDRFGTMIQATLFRDGVEKYGDFLQEGKVYKISRGNLKKSNKKFCSLPHDFSITLSKMSKIVECDEDERIGTEVISYKGINDICEEKSLLFLDFIGIIHRLNCIQRITTRNGDCKDKRQVTLADDSGLFIQSTFWGNHPKLEEVDVNEDTVIGIKGAKIHEFNEQKSLTIGDNSSIVLNPKTKRTQELKDWYSTQKNNLISINDFLSGKKEKGGLSNKNVSAPMSILREILTLSQVIDTEKFKPSTEGKKTCSFYTIVGRVEKFVTKKIEKNIYLACPEVECKKKVFFNQRNKYYKCEYCNKTFDECNPTYMIKAVISDGTDYTDLLFYGEQGTQILGGIPADKLWKLHEHKDREAIKDIFEDALQKYYQIIVKSSVNTFNEETNIQFSAVRVEISDFTQINQLMADRIKIYEMFKK